MRKTIYNKPPPLKLSIILILFTLIGSWVTWSWEFNDKYGKDAVPNPRIGDYGKEIRYYVYANHYYRDASDDNFVLPFSDGIIVPKPFSKTARNIRERVEFGMFKTSGELFWIPLIIAMLIVGFIMHGFYWRGMELQYYLPIKYINDNNKSKHVQDIDLDITNT